MWMIKYKCRQQHKLISDIPWLSPRQSKMLSGTVYHTFQEEILPYLPVDVFANFFSCDNGRPTKDIQSVLGLFILQPLFDMTDAEAVESFSFNDTFRYALDIPRGECLAERTYYYYRQKLLGEGHGVFEQVTQQIAKRIKLARRLQRKDSTLVETWLKTMSRLELFQATTRKFLAELKQCHPIIFSRLPAELREKYLPEGNSEAWFAGAKPSQYGEHLVAAAKDILSLIELFSSHPSVSGLDSFALLLRLAGEQIHVQDDQVEVRLGKEARGSALANPHDPEARYDGHREKVGYHVQLTETCSESADVDNPKIITQIEVDLANSPAGDLPDGFGVMDFQNEYGKRISQCSMGKKSLENKINVA